MTLGASTLLNIALLAIAGVIAFIYLRREHLREKWREDWLKWFSSYAKTARFKQAKSYDAQYMAIEGREDEYPSFEDVGFVLADLAFRAIEEPPEIPMPPLSVKRMIEPDDHVLVALIARDMEIANQAWVRVNEVWADDHFSGAVIDTAAAEDVRFMGMEITFNANHIGLVERPSLRPEAN